MEQWSRNELVSAQRRVQVTMGDDSTAQRTTRLRHAAVVHVLAISLLCAAVAWHRGGWGGTVLMGGGGVTRSSGEELVRITVPAHSRPGDMLEVAVPGRREREVPIPPGAKPGQVLEFAIPFRMPNESDIVEATRQAYRKALAKMKARRATTSLDQADSGLIQCLEQGPPAPSTVIFVNTEDSSSATDFGSHQTFALGNQNVDCGDSALNGFQLQSLGHLMRYNIKCMSGAHFDTSEVFCPSLMSLTFVLFATSLWISHYLKCRMTCNMSTQAKKTNWEDAGGGNIIYLDRQTVDCGSDGAISQFRLRDQGDQVSPF
jgi:hypothetical protein